MIRILLAEDDDVMREYLVRALERAGYAVEAVDRGTAALPLLGDDRFDLLLTDIVMPEMDGIELAQHAARIAPAMRVMFITGFAAVTLKAGQEVPKARVLSKPFHLRDLVAEVDRMFERERASAGEEIVIATAGAPKAKLVPYVEPALAPRKPGRWAHLLKDVSDEAVMAPCYTDEEIDAFENASLFPTKD